MSDLHSTVSSLEIEKRWVVEGELDGDDNISCETGAATVLASNKRTTNATVSHVWNSSLEQNRRTWRHGQPWYLISSLFGSYFSCVQVSPEKMQEDGSDQENVRLCRLVATLLWLVSVWTPPERGASSRRAVMRMFLGMLLGRFLNTQFDREDVYELLRQFGNPPQIYMTGTFVTELWTTLNAQDDRKVAYHQRDRLRRLLFDILANPPSMVPPPNQRGGTFNFDVSPGWDHCGAPSCIGARSPGCGTHEC